jgi:aryl-alcohol dehydrogenase-like predicted oxidoreductase
VSNFDKGQIERCLAIRHVDSLQQEFSMFVLDDRELIRWCGEQGIGVLTYGPLAYGLLAGAISMDTTFADGDFRGNGETWDLLFAPEARRRWLGIVDELRTIAERVGVTVAQLALGWTFHQEGVTGAIAGSRNPDHVRGNAAAGDVALDPTMLDEIEALLQR